jgi:hypothetical protein
MARRGTTAVQHPYARQRPNLTLVEGSRGKPALLTIRATELADLVDELTSAGADMVALASRLDLAVGNGRLDLVPEVADRLRRLGVMYRDCAKPGGVA